jgi:hypothetical protein
MLNYGRGLERAFADEEGVWGKPASALQKPRAESSGFTLCESMKQKSVRLALETGKLTVDD